MNDNAVQADDSIGAELSETEVGADLEAAENKVKAAPKQRNWRFLSRPFWLFSHIFVATALCLFVLAAFWQVGRWNDRKDTNELIRDRANEPAITVEQALEQPVEDLDYVRIVDEGHFIEANLIRVANRSYDGQAGDWMVGLYETTSGQPILVNRGFVPREGGTRDEEETTPIEGWLRESHKRETFGASDNGRSERVPRLDVSAIADRFGQLIDSPLAPVWIQQADSSVDTYPIAVPLPELNNGSHFSYAVQWTIFTLLTGGAYVLVLRKKALDSPDLD